MKSVFINVFEGRLRAGWRLVIQTALLFLLLTFLTLGTVLLIGLDSHQMDYLLWGELSFFAAVTISVLICRVILDRRSIGSMGLKYNRQTAIDLLFGFGLAGVLIGIIFLLEWSAGWLTIKKIDWFVPNRPDELRNLLAYLFLFIMVGWTEELLFRGYQLKNISDGVNALTGAIISSVFFSIFHIGNPGYSFLAFLGLFFSGLLFAFAVFRTHTLWLAIGLHIGWNIFEGLVYGFQVSGLTEMPRMIYQTVSGHEWITGGNFGPEAGVVLLPALGIAAWLIGLYTRGRKANQFSGES